MNWAPAALLVCLLNKQKMETRKTIITFSLFSLYFLSISFAATSTETSCSSAACGPGEPVIRFPFRVETLQPNSCGYPGFTLSCDSTGKQTLVNVPGSGTFAVRGIDYGTKEIWLNDPNNCLPSRLLSLNLSGTPFTGVYYQDFNLFNCSVDSMKYRQSQFSTKACLISDSTTHAVYATPSSSSLRGIRVMSPDCRLIAKVAVPVEWPFNEEVLPSDLRLAWSAPDCGRCESRGGRCGFKSNSTLDNVCTNAPKRGLSRMALYAITVGAGVPTLLFAFGLFCYISSRVNAYFRRRDDDTRLEPTSAVIKGLDELTIEKFPKVVLGESRHLPKPDCTACPICLSDYRSKDTLRSIPECQHCFHAQCIDEWLRLNATCPVCRTTPKRSLQTNGAQL